jgi:hypothetical protein
MTASPRGKPWGAAAPEVFLTRSEPPLLETGAVFWAFSVRPNIRGGFRDDRKGRPYAARCSPATPGGVALQVLP